MFRFDTILIHWYCYPSQKWKGEDDDDEVRVLYLKELVLEQGQIIVSLLEPGRKTSVRWVNCNS